MKTKWFGEDKVVLYFRLAVNRTGQSRKNLTSKSYAWFSEHFPTSLLCWGTYFCTVFQWFNTLKPVKCRYSESRALSYKLMTHNAHSYVPSLDLTALGSFYIRREQPEGYKTTLVQSSPRWVHKVLQYVSSMCSYFHHRYVLRARGKVEVRTPKALPRWRHISCSHQYVGPAVKQLKWRLERLEPERPEFQVPGRTVVSDVSMNLLSMNRIKAKWIISRETEYVPVAFHKHSVLEKYPIVPLWVAGMLYLLQRIISLLAH